MRIIDNEGKNVPYYEFHAPINHHDMKMTDPTYKVNPNFIVKNRAPGTTFIPIGYAMMHLNLGTNAEAQDEDEEFSHRYEWLSNVSDATAEGRSVLVSFVTYILYYQLI